MYSGICIQQHQSDGIPVNIAVKPKHFMIMLVLFRNLMKLYIYYKYLKIYNNFFYHQGFVNSGYGVNGIAHVSYINIHIYYMLFNFNVYLLVF